MGLQDIVQVHISLSNSVVTAAGFGIPLIAGSTQPGFSERYHVYTQASDMLADGYTEDNPEYLAASALMSQDQSPESFVVGRRLTPVAQVDTVTITAHDDTDYTLTVNGTEVTFTSDADATVAEIATGLIAAMPSGVTDVITVTNVANDIVLTAKTAGTPFTTVGEVDNLVVAHTTPNVADDIAGDLQDFRDAGAIWYATMLTSRDVDVAEAAAAWTEANAVPPTLLMLQTSESTSATNALDPEGTDLLNVLAALKYKRTATLWHADDDEYADAAWLGRELPVDPGSDNWALKVLRGISPDSLSSTIKGNIIGTDANTPSKKGNIYYSMTAQNPITSRGQVASGDWIDIIRFIDFLTARISEGIANLLLTTEKIEFDDTGLQQVASQVTGVLQQSKDAHKVVSYTVTTPRAADIPSANRAARKLDPPITFTALLSGALNSVKVTGTVTE